MIVLAGDVGGAGPFITAFRNKGRMSELLGRVPAHVIMNPNGGLLGAGAGGTGRAYSRGGR
jgi:glucokinase